MRLVDAVAKRASTGVVLRTGTVVAHTAPTCTLDLAGATLTGIPKLAAYTDPAPGDVVQVAQDGAKLLILGRVGTAGVPGVVQEQIDTQLEQLLLPAGADGQYLSLVGGEPTWVAAPDTGAGVLATRVTAQLVTTTLAAGARASATLNLTAGYRLLKVTTNTPARVRLYTTTAARTADAARLPSTPPAPGSGVVLDYATTATFLGGPLSPLVDGWDDEAVPDGDVPVTVDNTASAPVAIVVDVVYLPTEGT